MCDEGTSTRLFSGRTRLLLPYLPQLGGEKNTHTKKNPLTLGFVY